MANIYKYCPSIMQSRRTRWKQIVAHKHSQTVVIILFKRELNDRVKDVPWENPFETRCIRI